jgi:predicted N-acetyltransferase YhbS
MQTEIVGQELHQELKIECRRLTLNEALILHMAMARSRFMHALSVGRLQSMVAYIATLDKEMVGVICFDPLDFEGYGSNLKRWFEMGPIWVRPKFRGQRVFKMLLEHAHGLLDNNEVFATSHNPIVVHTLVKLGFNPVSCLQLPNPVLKAKIKYFLNPSIWIQALARMCNRSFEFEPKDGNACKSFYGIRLRRRES